LTALPADAPWLAGAALTAALSLAVIAVAAGFTRRARQTSRSIQSPSLSGLGPLKMRPTLNYGLEYGH